MKKKILRKNLKYLVPIILLLSISLLDMYGASFISPLYKGALVKQSLWIVIGFIVMFLIYKIDLKLLLKYSFFFYILGLVLLLLVLFFGKNVNGANSWFKIGPVSFQPSELFKFFYILFLAKVINKHKGSSFKLLFKIILVTFLPCLLIFLEPDTGVVLMYILMMIGVIFVSRVNKKQLTIISLIFIVCIASFMSLYFLKQDLFIKMFGTSFFYRMDRLVSFTDNSSYQLKNALVGIGSAGYLGMGITSKKIYIPEVTTDFVFALTICNFGLIAGVLVILIYAYLLFRIYLEILRSKKYLYKCILSGIFSMMFFQVLEHIFMNMGLTPITGITLPFLSYGGS